MARRRLDAASWRHDVQQTSYIIQCSADRLHSDRERCSTVSNEWEGIISEQESKLVKHFARILFLHHEHTAGDNGAFASTADDELTGGSAPAASLCNLRSWLRVVNVQPKAIVAIESAVQSLSDILNLDQSSLSTLCDLCQVHGENARRFVTATRNLINYTNRWIALGREPVDEYRDVDLCWFGFDRRISDVSGGTSAVATTAAAGSASSSNFLAERQQRGGAGDGVGNVRTLSESGVDSGASDSGVGSNVSQTSLPTTTPPPSPGFLMAPSVSVSGRPSTSSSSMLRAINNAAQHRSKASASQAAAAVAAKRATKAASSTPPPTLHWGALMAPKRSVSGVPGESGAPLRKSSASKSPILAAATYTTMTRSQSHESNLPHRIVKDAAADRGRATTAGGGTGGVQPMTLPMAMSRSATTDNSNVFGGANRRHESSTSSTSSAGGSVVAMAASAATSGTNRTWSTLTSGESAGGPLLSPTSPTPGSASFFGATSSYFHPRSASASYGAAASAVPKSPRTGRLLHNIPHVWTKRPNIRHLTDPCQSCRKPLGIVSEKCRSCKIKVHSDCKAKLGSGTCGLKPEHLRAMVFSVVSGGSDAWGGGDRLDPSAGTSPGTKSRALSGGGTATMIPSSRSVASIPHMPSTPGPSFPSATSPSYTSAGDYVESSSSTGSSTPSTPAQLLAHAAAASAADRSPYPQKTAAQQQTFLFPDVPEVPDIVLQESVEDTNNFVESQDSDASTIRIGSNGSGPGTESERTLSQEGTLTDSADSQQGAGGGLEGGGGTPGGHPWSRHNWNMTTIRGVSSSASAWRDVTIPFDKIQFAADSLVGRGQFGEVHKGYWYQPVAVKLLNMDHVDDQLQLETFKQEVASFKNTRHENIVLFVGYCLDPPKLGIVMNFCRGKTLHNVLHNSREAIEMSRVVHISAQICQGMSYLHTKRILHKDLRTKNIFLEGTEKGSGPVSDKRRLEKVVITDFGLFSMRRLCKLQEAQTECKVLHVPEHWLCYLAPEMMRHLSANKTGEELPFSFSSDVYSFGTIWYELLTGEFPFKKYPAEAIVWQVGRGMKPALNNIHTARDVKEILMHCWSYETEKRADFNEVLKALERLPKKRLARSPSHPIQLSRSAEAMF